MALNRLDGGKQTAGGRKYLMRTVDRQLANI